MAFDPQAYIKAKQAALSQPPVAPAGTAAAPFDPAAFVAAKQQPVGEQPGMLESFGRGALQTGTLGFADEISGGVESLFTDKTYHQARDESRANFDAAREANPLTTGAGNIVGGIASSIITPGLGLAGKALGAVPGIGVALAGSKVARAAALGAGLGGVQGVGDSTASDAGGMLADATSGAKTGAMFGAGSQIAAKVVGAGVNAVGDYLSGAFAPTLQRLKAFGANPSPAAIEKAGGVKAVAEGMDEAVKHGIANDIGGRAPNPIQGFQVLDTVMDQQAAKMHEVMGHSFPKVAEEEFIENFGKPLLAKLEGEGLTADMNTGIGIVGDLMQDIRKTEGDLPKLWKLKKQFGAEVSWSDRPLSLDPQIKTKLYQDATGLLDSMIINHLDEASKAMDSSFVDDFVGAKESYAKLSKVWPLMKKAADSFATQGDKGSAIKISDQLKAAGIGAGIGSITGVPGLGAAAGIAGAVGGAALRSTSGRLARAKIGEMLNVSAMGSATKAATDAAGQAMGMIPRTLGGFRDWVGKNAPMIPEDMRPAVQEMLSMPDAAAEIRVRALMPFFTQFMSPSQYKSEFNGKITAPEDRVTARQIIMAQGLPPSVTSWHMTALNKSGALQEYHYAKTAVDYGDEVINFNSRLTQMGY